MKSAYKLMIMVVHLWLLPLKVTRQLHFELVKLSEPTHLPLIISAGACLKGDLKHGIERLAQRCMLLISRQAILNHTL